MSRIETNHEIVGKKLREIGKPDLGTLYPVVDEELTVIGVYSAEFGAPAGCALDENLQAFVATNIDARKTIEDCQALQDLIQSEAWANDGLGLLHREALNIMLALPGVDEAAALEWLHEED